MMGQKTYWHLQALQRKPTEYDVGTSKLLYYLARGFEVRTPIDWWYEQYQRASPLRAPDWDAFRDPRETTYSKYTEIQKTKESFVDGLFRSIDETGYDRNLSRSCISLLDRVLPVLRYSVHGLQMTAAYVGCMAPGGRIVVACLFQAADEMRRIQRLAYRMRQLQETHPGFGSESKSAWERNPHWQPLREVIEKLLVTYDWGEAFVALNLVLKPSFDQVFMLDYGDRAHACGEEVLHKILRSLYEDCAWHRDWSRAFVHMLVESEPENRRVIERWVDAWGPLASAGLGALAPVFDDGGARCY